MKSRTHCNWTELSVHRKRHQRSSKVFQNLEMDFDEQCYQERSRYWRDLEFTKFELLNGYP